MKLKKKLDITNSHLSFQNILTIRLNAYFVLKNYMLPKALVATCLLATIFIEHPPIEDVVPGIDVKYHSDVFQDKEGKWFRRNFMVNVGKKDVSINWATANLFYSGLKKLHARSTTKMITEKIEGPYAFPSVITYGPFFRSRYPTNCYVDDKRLFYSAVDKQQTIKQVNDEGVPIVEINTLSSFVDDLNIAYLNLNISKRSSVLFPTIANASYQFSDSAIHLTTLKSFDDVQAFSNFGTEEIHLWIDSAFNSSSNVSYVYLENTTAQSQDFKIISNSQKFEYKPVKFFSFLTSGNYGGIGFTSDIFVAK